MLDQEDEELAVPLLWHLRELLERLITVLIKVLRTLKLIEIPRRDFCFIFGFPY